MGGHPGHYGALSIPGPHSLDVWKTPVKDHNPEKGTLQQDLFTKLNLEAQPRNESENLGTRVGLGELWQTG